MTTLKLKLDENLARRHVEILQEAGYDAESVFQEGMSGASDDQLWDAVCREGRMLVTLDLDFSDLRRYPPGTHPGILLLRPPDRSREGVESVLVRVLREGPLDGLAGCLSVADADRTRVRRQAAPEAP